MSKLFSGFNEHELTRIIEILERHQVPFDVRANEQGIVKANAIISSNEYTVARGKAGAKIDNSFYSIAFDRNRLRNLSVKEIRELKKLRIFPENMAEPEEEPEVIPVVNRTPNIRFVGTSPWTAVITMLALLCLAWGYFNFR